MADMKVRKLGRGLSALIGEPVSVDVRPSVAVATNVVAEGTKQDTGQKAGATLGLVDVGVEEIAPSAYQTRSDFDESQLAGLVESIKRTGLMQPVVLRKRVVGGGPRRVGTGGDRSAAYMAGLSPEARLKVRYELVAGERRWRAARAAGLATVPAVVRDLSDEEAAEWGVVENLQRQDLNPMERAWSYRMLAQEFRLSQEEIAARVGQDRSTVANFVRLLELEKPVQDLIAAGKLTPGHGKALLAMRDPELQVRAAADAAANGRSVRWLEQVAGTVIEKRGVVHSPAMTSAEAARFDMERRLSARMGTRVDIVTKEGGKSGKIVIHFYGLDEFDGICEKVGVGQ